jgi:type I restriction enzyme M protein
MNLLLHECDVHTLLRLPTGIFYAQGVKTNPLKREDLDDFVACYHPENRHERTAARSEATPEARWRAFSYEELVARDKASLDLFWLRDESPEDSANLPDPDVLAAEIVEDLEAALDQFAQLAADMGHVEGVGAAV